MRRASIRPFRLRGQAYIFSVSNCTLFRPDTLANDILGAIPEAGAISLPQLLGSLDGRWPREAVEVCLEELQRARIIESPLPPTTPSPRTVLVPSAPLTTLVCILTRSCNLTCSYCYCRLGTAAEQSPSMSESQAKRAIDFLIAGSGNVRDLNLVFFGGEPLIVFPLIESMVAYARGRAAESGKRIKYSLTTNGTLLTDQVIKFVTSNLFSLTVSLDGPREIHDSVRVRADGRGSYAEVVRNVQPLFQGAPAMHVGARVTITRRAVDLKRILFHLLRLGFAEVGFSPASSTDPEYMLTVEDLRVFTQQFEELAQLYCKRAAQGEYLGFSNLSNLLRLLHEGAGKKYPCGAGLGLVAVDGDGYLYLCHRLAGHAGARIGHIATGLEAELRRSFLSGAHVDSKEECSDCWARHLCGGGCYFESLLYSGRLTSPAQRYCPFLRRWFEIGLEAYLRILEDRPAFFRLLGSRQLL